MYNEYFGFKEAPFSIAPDPQFLYMSDRHREALAHLLYGFQSDGGFVLLTGEVGTGKTTVCRCLLEQVPENSDIAFVLNPKLTATELLETICDELRIETPQGTGSIKVYIDAINRFLLAAHSNGRKTVLIIDEAQNLSVSVLEQLRLLTNLETNKQKLLQVIMLGQPELKQMLEQPELRQLAQRVTARYHLEPLAKSEIKAYVSHRLAVAGVERTLFPAATLDKLYQLTGGVPRLLNLLCDRALLAAYVREVQTVSPALLAEAAREVFGRSPKPQRSSSSAWKWLLFIPATGFGIALLVLFPRPGSSPLPTQAITPPVAQDQIVPSPPWDEQLDITNSAELAYQQLFQVWGRNYQAEQGAASEQAARYGLVLSKKRGSIGRLKQLNSPAVLQLQNSQEEKFYATLTELSDDTATLVVGSQQRVIPLVELAACWLGEFELLWQLPPHYIGPVRPGDSGRVVTWLDQQMAELNDRSPREEGNVIFNGQLLKEVKRFQQGAGLEPDGIVGPYTLILLNARLNPLQPTLSVGLKG